MVVVWHVVTAGNFFRVYYLYVGTRFLKILVDNYDVCLLCCVQVSKGQTYHYRPRVVHEQENRHLLGNSKASSPDSLSIIYRLGCKFLVLTHSGRLSFTLWSSWILSDNFRHPLCSVGLVQVVLCLNYRENDSS